jgi:hypothetical protein
MHDLDSLLKHFEQPTKPAAKDNHSYQQPKLPVPILPSFQKADSMNNDQRKFPNPHASFPQPNEQRRPSILKQPIKPSVDQSFDIDAILQGRSTQQQPASKGASHQIGPAKNSATPSRRDSLSEWFNEERSTGRNVSQAPNLFSSKVSTNATGKPSIDFNPDDLFSNSRDQSAAKLPSSTTKTSAKQYYMGNSRYKPGLNPKQAIRRDSFNLLPDPTNNSNSACTYLSHIGWISLTFLCLARAPKMPSYMPTFGEQRKRTLNRLR